MLSTRPVLIAVSVTAIQPNPPYNAAFVRIVGKSRERKANFHLETNMMRDPELDVFKRWSGHGFTVIELTEYWESDRIRLAEHWEESIVNRAMKQIEALTGATGEREITATGYDEELAARILQVVNEAFPNPIESMDLKHRLSPEPSDAALSTALEALLLEELITGTPLRSGRHLDALAQIKITATGRRRLSGAQQPAASSHVVHGDQIINYGQAGAIGRGSTGNVRDGNWSEMSQSVDLPELARKLKELRSELLKRASSSDDYMQVALVTSAEEQADKQEGGKVLETLSRLRVGALSLARDIGVDIAASVIAKATGLTF